MLRVASDGSTFLREMTSWPPFWKCDVKSKIRLCQRMRIYVKTISAKFHPDPILNDGALGFLKEVAPTRRRATRTRWVSIWDQDMIDVWIAYCCKNMPRRPWRRTVTTHAYFQGCVQRCVCVMVAEWRRLWRSRTMDSHQLYWAE